MHGSLIFLIDISLAKENIPEAYYLSSIILDLLKRFLFFPILILSIFSVPKSQNINRGTYFPFEV
jgi:hypothetical protein